MPKTKRSLLFQTLICSVMLMLSACGARQSANAVASVANPVAVSTAKPAVSVAKPAAASSGKASSVDVKLKTYGVMPSVTTISAGDVTFNVTNTAADLEHEMLVVQTDLAPDALPYDLAAQVIPEDKVNKLGEVSELKPGTSGSVTLNLPPGKYLLFCNILSHFKHGMVASLVVTK